MPLVDVGVGGLLIVLLVLLVLVLVIRGAVALVAGLVAGPGRRRTTGGRSPLTAVA